MSLLRVKALEHKESGPIIQSQHKGMGKEPGKSGGLKRY